MSRSYLCLGLWGVGSLCYALTAFLAYQYWLSPDDGLKSNSRPVLGVNSQLLDTPTYKQHNQAAAPIV